MFFPQGNLWVHLKTSFVSIPISGCKNIRYYVNFTYVGQVGNVMPYHLIFVAKYENRPYVNKLKTFQKIGSATYIIMYM